jgi:hypothetical protein
VLQLPFRTQEAQCAALIALASGGQERRMVVNTSRNLSWRSRGFDALAAKTSQSAGSEPCA